MSIRCLLLLAALSLSACAQPKGEDANRKPAVDELGTCDMQFTNSQICIDFIWERKPTETEFGSFVLEFYSPDNHSQFIDPPGSLSVHLWMPKTEQGAPSVRIEKLSMGQYRVSKVFFTMHGDWEIQLKLLKGSNILDQAVNPIHF